MSNFFSRIAEIAILGNYPFLHWIVFDTIGLMFLRLFLGIFISEIYSLFTSKNIQRKESIKMILFSLMVLIILFYFLFELCINKSYDALLYVAIFSILLAIYIFLKTIYDYINALRITTKSKY